MASPARARASRMFRESQVMLVLLLLVSCLLASMSCNRNIHLLLSNATLKKTSRKAASPAVGALPTLKYPAESG
jgi:hypothetical protein